MRAGKRGERLLLSSSDSWLSGTGEIALDGFFFIIDCRACSLRMSVRDLIFMLGAGLSLAVAMVFSETIRGSAGAVLTGDRRLLGLTVAMFLLTIFRMEATFGETLLSGSLNSVSVVSYSGVGDLAE